MAERSEANATLRHLAEWARAYTRGELDATEAAAFEDRLALDQAARDALVAAVQTDLGPDPAALRPDPAYRREVIRRLSPNPVWAWLKRTAAAIRPPVRWGLAGLAVVAVLAVGVWMLPRPASVVPTIVERQALPELPSAPLVTNIPEGASDPKNLARFWSELPRGDHLVKAVEEEQARRLKQDVIRPGRPDATAYLQSDGPVMP